MAGGSVGDAAAARQDPGYTLEELNTTIEELRVTEEELRHQNEELEAAREALEEERQRYQELFEFAPGAYLVTDLFGHIREANAAAEALLGYPRGKLARRPLAAYVVAEQTRSFRARLAEAAEGREVRDWEVRLQPREGEPVDVAVSVSVQRGGGGRAVAIWWLLRDVSERNRAEEEIRALNAGLERRVLERTAQLQEADAAKDRFLAMLAHELRNPLGAILTATELLAQFDLDDPRFRRARDTIERQARHQARLLDDLLNVTRIARGKITLQVQRMDLGRLVCDAGRDWEAAVRDAGLALRVQVPDDPVWIDADPTRIAQVLDNLLHNAVKFTEAGEVALTLETRPEEGRAAIRVHDTGVGIALELLPHLFTPFTQAEQPLNRPRGGLGLGLALVKGLVEMHGGEISAASAGPGKGAEFTVLLPLAESAGVAPAPEPEAQAPERPLRVLLIDDNRDALEVLKDVLEMTSEHEVAVAYTGESGVEMARRFHPDVVVCDIGLPGMDGYAVARALRGDPATAGIGLIAVSGYAQEQDRHLSQEAGFDRHLPKPIDADILERTIAEVARGG